MTDEMYARLAEAYNPNDRVADCPDPDASYLTQIECNFQMPVWLTQDQQRRLHDLLSEVVNAQWNQPKEGCHWLAGWGAKPKWNEPNEPTFNDEVLHGETCARQFVSDTERDRKMAERAKGEELSYPTECETCHTRLDSGAEAFLHTCLHSGDKRWTEWGNGTKLNQLPYILFPIVADLMEEYKKSV